MLFVRSICRCCPVSTITFKSLPRQYSIMSRPLEGQIALVTGASRGIGRGVALQLGQAGATVYITGRKPESSLGKQYDSIPSLEKTANDIKERGGECVPVYCDHSNHEEIADLFERIEKENGGVLDVLVNCAFSAVKDMGDEGSKKFYELDPLFWDKVNNVGLRNNYICCTHAARMMVKRNAGLIVNISSAGALQYTFNVAYGVGKAALDRMSADMAVELRPSKVSIVSLWPGMVKTEMSYEMMKEGKVEAMTKQPKAALEKAFLTGESIEFAGKAVVALASDKKVNNKSGRVMMTYDVARDYGFKDIDNKLPMDIRQVSTALDYFGYTNIAKCVPGFIRIPLFGMHFASYKF